MKQKFSEAALQMKVGDKFRVIREDGPQCDDFELCVSGSQTFFKTKTHERLTLSVWHFEVEGEIIRAEPEVLTADEIKEKVLSELVQINIPSSSMVLKSARLGVENGQIKEWKRLKPLIDAVKSYQGDTGQYGDLKNVLKNLTPPWETEK